MAIEVFLVRFCEIFVMSAFYLSLLTVGLLLPLFWLVIFIFGNLVNPTILLLKFFIKTSLLFIVWGLEECAKGIVKYGNWLVQG